MYSTLHILYTALPPLSSLSWDGLTFFSTFLKSFSAHKIQRRTPASFLAVSKFLQAREKLRRLSANTHQILIEYLSSTGECHRVIYHFCPPKTPTSSLLMFANAIPSLSYMHFPLDTLTHLNSGCSGSR